MEVFGTPYMTQAEELSINERGYWSRIAGVEVSAEGLRGASATGASWQQQNAQQGITTGPSKQPAGTATKPAPAKQTQTQTQQQKPAQKPIQQDQHCSNSGRSPHPGRAARVWAVGSLPPCLSSSLYLSPEPRF